MCGAGYVVLTLFRFSNIKGITAVSATTGTGVDQLTDMLKDIAMYDTRLTWSSASR